MSISNEIRVKYVNNTGSTNIQVVVFTKNFSLNTPTTYYSAWLVLKAQSQASFVYPVEIGVGASYEQDGQTVIAGPFPANLGSTWCIKQNTPSDTVVLAEDKSVPDNPDAAIVVKNLKPKSWTGQKLDIGMYKSGRQLVVHKAVRVNDQVDFMLQPKLYFAVARNMYAGKAFTSLEVSSTMTLFDLSQYQYGMEVTLNQKPVSGEYSFTAKSLM